MRLLNGTENGNDGEVDARTDLRCIPKHWRTMIRFNSMFAYLSSHMRFGWSMRWLQVMAAFVNVSIRSNVPCVCNHVSLVCSLLGDLSTKWFLHSAKLWNIFRYFSPQKSFHRKSWIISSRKGCTKGEWLNRQMRNKIINLVSRFVAAAFVAFTQNYCFHSNLISLSIPEIVTHLFFVLSLSPKIAVHLSGRNIIT